MSYRYILGLRFEPVPGTKTFAVHYVDRQYFMDEMSNIVRMPGLKKFIDAKIKELSKVRDSYDNSKANLYTRKRIDGTIAELKTIQQNLENISATSQVDAKKAASMVGPARR